MLIGRPRQRGITSGPNWHGWGRPRGSIDHSPVKEQTVWEEVQRLAGGLDGTSVDD
jgi:hypothetical protein